MADDAPQLLVGTESLELIARTIVDADARVESSSPVEDTMSTDGGLPTISVIESGESTDGTIDLEIVEQLGRGGMASVFRARQHSVNRDVAIKLANDSRAGAGAALLYEAKLAGALEHPNIVPVHMVGRDPAGRTVIVMKRIAGTTWGELLRQRDDTYWKSRSRDRVRFNVETMIHVCNAVAFAHAHGVLHRDIKPANVMIGEFGEVYLVDWGIAIHKDRKHDGSIVGTPAYMAPETLARQPVDERTDVYLLGATLHEALTGRPRHTGTSVPEVLRSAAESRPVIFPDDVPEELAAICNRATHRDPALRFASAADLRRSLEAFLVHRASNDLAARAAATLVQLEEPLGPDAKLDQMRVRFAECRFGFQGALSQWPKNTMARAGLRRAVERMFELELEHGSLDAAEALLADAEALGAPQSLRERFKASPRKRRMSRAPVDTERALRFSSSADKGATDVAQRTRAVAIAGLALVVGTLLLGELIRLAGVEITNRLGVMFNLGVFALANLARSLFRRRILKTEYNLSKLDGLQAFLVGTVVLRATAWYLNVDALIELRFEAVATAMVLGTIAVAVDRALSRAALFSAMCAVASILLSWFTFELVLLCQLGPIVWATASQYRRAARIERTKATTARSTHGSSRRTHGSSRRSRSADAVSSRRA